MGSGSIFDGTDGLIHEALDLNVSQTLKQKSTCAALEIPSDIMSRVERLVSELYARVEQNWSGRIPSGENWRLRRQTDIALHNRSPEVLLERAIVLLSKRGLLEGWHNQIPVASGLMDEHADKRAAIDLVHTAEGFAELVELKWQSDTPAFAAFEILRYGLAYLFWHQRRDEFDCQNVPLFTMSKIGLRCLAPSNFYSYSELQNLEKSLDRGLQGLFAEKTNGSVSVDFQFLSFPPDFELPFVTGEEITRLLDLPQDAPPIARLLDAMNNLEHVCGAEEVTVA